MKFTICLNNGNNIELEFNSYNAFDICEKITRTIKSSDIQKITTIKASQTYVVKNKKSGMFDENRSTHDISIKELKDILDTYSPFINIKVLITNITNYTFDIEFEGNLFDIIGIIKSLDIPSVFQRLDYHLNIDISLYDLLIRDIDSRISLNDSLIIRFISERNGNLGYSKVFDILRNDIPRTGLKEYIGIIFQKIYNQKVEEARVMEINGDKLSLKSILNSKIKELDDEIGNLLKVGDNNE